eukprot:TRINITY_DN2199_c0_g2_i1.p1 TRINITY_DN2199_c0_g2~~TRINITY_DN2199_c0_g2_i1.p1  ORF type:complete len:1014 (-),score=340.09 TRINITY_DN2199_c0_g2_i1:171-3212(-)
MMNYQQMYQQQYAQQNPAAYQQMYQQAAAAQQAQQGYAAAQAQAGVQQGYQTAQAGAAAAQAQQAAGCQAAQQAAGKDNLVGSAAHIAVQGCTHATVGGIVRGSFTANGQNHGRPTYKKDQQVNGLDVQLYFWDERDGPNFSGWWFGPKVGGDQVWAYHPSKDAMTPPKTGWKVPYDGPVDQTFVISATQGQQGQQQQSAQQPAQQQHGYGQQQAYQQQQQAYQQQQQMQQMQQQQLQRQQQMQQQMQQQQLQQQQAAARQQQEMAKQQEFRQKQQEELRLKAEQQKRQLEEAHRKRMEDQKRIAEESKACFAVRQAIQQVRISTEETLATKQQELAEAMQKNLANCGASADRVKAESEQAVDQAQKRIEALKEARRKEAERKAEQEKKAKEAQEKAEKLLTELEGKIESADGAVKALTTAAGAFDSPTLTKMTAITKAAGKVDQAGEAAFTALEECSSFVKENGASMTIVTAGKAPQKQEPGEVPKEPPAAGRTLPALVKKLNDLQKQKQLTVQKAQTTKVSLTKKVEAKTQLDSKASKFTKFDANKDGLLDEKEIANYAKKEYGISLPKASMTKILASLSRDGKKGVKKDDFQNLVVQVGIAREATKDAQRRKKREAHEKQLEEMKTSLRAKVAEVDQSSAAIEEAVKAVEEAGKPLSGKDLKGKTSQEILPLVDEAEAKVEKAKASAEELQKEASALKEDINPELLNWIINEAKPITGKAARLLTRLNNVTGLLTKARNDAKIKDAIELKKLETQVVDMLKYHQQAKTLTVADLYGAVSENKDEVDKDSFLKFFKACEKKQPAEDSTEKGAGSMSDEDAERVFAYLVDNKESETISKDRMMSLIRTYMKVTKDTVLTGSLSIKATDSKRRLEVGEVLEILGVPTAEGEVEEVKRVQCKALKDNAEGWVTLCGNKGENFLVPHTVTFKVVKETIMTETFELDSEEAKEATKKLKDREPRKLRPGELVEVWIWPKKEEKSGLERLKCRTKSDGLAGWVTAVGNAGTVFLQMA